jgi:hypothetical protein
MVSSRRHPTFSPTRLTYHYFNPETSPNNSENVAVTMICRRSSELQVLQSYCSDMRSNCEFILKVISDILAAVVYLPRGVDGSSSFSLSLIIEKSFSLSSLNLDLFIISSQACENV